MEVVDRQPAIYQHLPVAPYSFVVKRIKQAFLDPHAALVHQIVNDLIHLVGHFLVVGFIARRGAQALRGSKANERPVNDLLWGHSETRGQTGEGVE